MSKNKKKNSFFIVLEFLKKNFKWYSPLLFIVIGVYYEKFVNDWEKEVQLYDSKSILARPLLKIENPTIDSIVFYYDSVAVLEYLSYENMHNPEKTMHSIFPQITIFYRVKVSNQSNSIGYRYGECATDSFTTSYFVRNEIFNINVPFTESESRFEWLTLGNYDTNQISFAQNIIAPAGEKFCIHLDILYSNEYDVLFDSYFIGKYDFHYPTNNLIVSRRTLFRNYQKGIFRVKGDVEDVQLYYAQTDTKTFSYDEAQTIFKKADYYHKQNEAGELLIDKRY